MGGFPAPSRPPTLRLLRAVGSAEPHWSRVEEELLASVARVLEEVRANGVEIRRRGDRLGVEELHELRGQLARFGWERDFLPGESSTRPLHGEHDGWGPPLDGAPEAGCEEHRLPWLVLALDALDFLAGAMGPDDILLWTEETP